MDCNYQVLLIGIQGHQLSEKEKLYLSDFNPGGVVLFNRNIKSASQVAALSQEIYQYCQTPPLITIDQEGGLVSRLRPILNTMETEDFANRATPEQIFRYGALTARVLSLLGIGLNFAPVVDIKYSDADNALRTRYWGSDKKTVVARARQFLLGMESQGVLGCLKHFPGLGNTDLDSHVTMPVNHNSLDDLKNTELYPYTALKDETSMVMISHCFYPAFAERLQIPASASPINYQMLREEVGFAGVAITDDLGMGGIANEKDLQGRIKDTLNAGANLLPFCNNSEDIRLCFPLLKTLLKNKEVNLEKFQTSLALISSLKERIKPCYQVPDDVEGKFKLLSDEIKELNLEVLGNERS